MVQFVEMYAVLFEKIDYIYTEYDPKVYDTNQLRSRLK
jgi:hypothetical protein